MTTAKTLKLEYPVTVEGKTWTEINFRRPKAGELEKAERLLKEAGCDMTDRISSGVISIAAHSDMPVEAVRELDAVDFQNAMEMSSSFLKQPSRSRVK
jgi:hypothetical protein